LPEDERLDGRREFDTREYVYKYRVLDVESASVKANRENGATGERDRSEFFKEYEVKIYPDTLTWSHDYSYSFNDPFTKNYFWHSAFDDYPVVGVNWEQANAFAHWRTNMMNTFLRKIKQPTMPEFRLPTESEWEYASRGGLDASPYPWGGPYTRNIKGCFLANFKPLRGNYVADGGLKAIKTASYNPNGYGLYDMAGNVAEWTSNAYDESAYSYSHDMNSDYHYDANEEDHQVLKRKSIRGGSWKDIAYFIQTSTRTFEYQDTAKSHIGFRCAVDFLGRDKKDFQ
jgi:gliding motility-associated lipoprotein GldK